MSRLFDIYGKKIPKGELIFKEGDDADVLYMIHKGKVEIKKKSGNIQKTLQVLGEGEFVGEMAVIDSLPRSANAIALEECHLIEMDKVSFDTSINENHQFAIGVIQFLTKRLRDTNDKVIHLSQENMSLQIKTELLKELITSGKKDKSGSWYLLEFTSLLEKLKSRFTIRPEKLVIILDELIDEEFACYKKDPSGKKWVAFKAG
jgi:CRP-like cAMP-binding protein